MHASPEGSGAASRFETLLDRGRLPLGKVTGQQVMAEVGPVLESLAALREPDDANELDRFEFRECFALVTLLGRRLALLDLTPTAALGVASAAVEAASVPELFAKSVMASCMEGFVRGREERVNALHESRLGDAIGPVRVSSTCYLLMPVALDDPEQITEKVDELARKLFEKDAKVAIIDFSQMGTPSSECAAPLLGAEAMTKMLGVNCIFSGMSEGWMAAAQQAGIDLNLLTLTTDLAEALKQAEDANGSRGSQQPGWMHRLWDRVTT